MVSGIVCENGKKSRLMFILGQGVPSQHGMRPVVSIHQGFLPFPVGDGLFKDTSDGSAFTAMIGDPIQALGKRVVFVINAMVAKDLIQEIASFCAKARVGH